MCHRETQGWGEMCTVGCCELVEAGVCTPAIPSTELILQDPWFPSTNPTRQPLKEHSKATQVWKQRIPNPILWAWFGAFAYERPQKSGSKEICATSVSSAFPKPFWPSNHFGAYLLAVSLGACVQRSTFWKVPTQTVSSHKPRRLRLLFPLVPKVGNGTNGLKSGESKFKLGWGSPS